MHWQAVTLNEAGILPKVNACSSSLSQYRHTLQWPYDTQASLKARLWVYAYIEYTHMYNFLELLPKNSNYL